MGSKVPPITPSRSLRSDSPRGVAAIMLVALAVRVLVRVLAVRVSVLFHCLMAVAKVGVGEGHEHENQQQGEHGDTEDPRLGPQRGEFLVAAFCLGGNGRGDLLKQHLLP
jgi:hypothetical protein